MNIDATVAKIYVMRCSALELEAEVSPLEEGSLIREESLVDDWVPRATRREKSAPVRK